MTDSDLEHLRSAIALSRRSRERGNQPFGALLAGPDGQVLLEAENTVMTGPDCTGHAVTNLMRLASRQFTSDFLAGCSLYASTEPCPMCGGAIFWGGVGRVVFALSERAFYQLVGPDCDGLRVGCRDVFAHGQRPIEVQGPALEDEALAVHRGFWGAADLRAYAAHEPSSYVSNVDLQSAPDRPQAVWQTWSLREKSWPNWRLSEEDCACRTMRFAVVVC
jgi:tRNA(Arg) A34 adenosine deaminase TadA